MAEKPSQEDVLRIVDAGAAAFADRKMVLVGGQALLFWANRYRECPGLVAIGAEPLASGDIDFTGGPEVAAMIAKAIGGSVISTTDKFDPSVTNAIVTYRDADGDTQKIDFIKVPLGIKEGTKEFMEACIPMSWDNHAIMIMNPFQVLKSRLANLHILPTHQGEHSQAQCMASVHCMREFTREVAGTDSKRALKLIKELKGYLFGHDTPRAVWRDHGIDAREAILPPIETLPDMYRSKEFPSIMKQLKKKWRDD